MRTAALLLLALTLAGCRSTTAPSIPTHIADELARPSQWLSSYYDLNPQYPPLRSLRVERLGSRQVIVAQFERAPQPLQLVPHPESPEHLLGWRVSVGLLAGDPESAQAMLVCESGAVSKVEDATLIPVGSYTVNLRDRTLRVSFDPALLSFQPDVVWLSALAEPDGNASRWVAATSTRRTPAELAGLVRRAVLLADAWAVR